MFNRQVKIIKMDDFDLSDLDLDRKRVNSTQTKNEKQRQVANRKNSIFSAGRVFLQRSLQKEKRQE